MCIVMAMIARCNATPMARNEINVELASIAKKLSSNTTHLLHIINASNNANKVSSTDLAYKTMINSNLFKTYPVRTYI